MATTEYHVRLDAFEGPLDLLLFLIRKAEVDITDIPIATITEQYLEYLSPSHGMGGGVEHIDIETAGEFLVMAATLMEIKSRMIAPPSPSPAGEDGEGAGRGNAMNTADGSGGAGGDPRAELVRQLLEYKRYRDATTRLGALKSEWEQRYPSAPHAMIAPAKPEDAEEEPDDTPLELDDVSLVDLVEAFGRIMEAVDFSRVGEHHVLLDETPVEEHADAIVANLAALDAQWRTAMEEGRDPAAALAETPGVVDGKLTFASVFVGKNRAEMIGLFLAMLELVKQRRIAFTHAEVPDGEKGELLLSLVESEEELAVNPESPA